jgi:hypothetical protein
VFIVALVFVILSAASCMSVLVPEGLRELPGLENTFIVSPSSFLISAYADKGSLGSLVRTPIIDSLFCFSVILYVLADSSALDSRFSIKEDLERTRQFPGRLFTNSSSISGTTEITSSESLAIL